jgi:hypothetical protein
LHFSHYDGALFCLLVDLDVGTGHWLPPTKHRFEDDIPYSDTAETGIPSTAASIPSIRNAECNQTFQLPTRSRPSQNHVLSSFR